MILELTPEIEQRIAEEAERHGQQPNDYVLALLNASLIAAEPQHQPTYESRTPQERAHAFREWAESHAYVTAPPLSDEALRRENIYED